MPPTRDIGVDAGRINLARNGEIAVRSAGEAGAGAFRELVLTEIALLFRCRIKFRWEINERTRHAISVRGIGPIRSAETKLLHMSRTRDASEPCERGLDNDQTERKHLHGFAPAAIPTIAARQ